MNNLISMGSVISLGQHGPYLVSQVSCQQFNLIALKSGNRYSSDCIYGDGGFVKKQKILDMLQVSEEQATIFDSVEDYYKYECNNSCKKQCSTDMDEDKLYMLLCQALLESEEYAGHYKAKRILKTICDNRGVFLK